MRNRLKTGSVLLCMLITAAMLLSGCKDGKTGNDDSVRSSDVSNATSASESAAIQATQSDDGGINIDALPESGAKPSAAQTGEKPASGTQNTGNGQSVGPATSSAPESSAANTESSGQSSAASQNPSSGTGSLDFEDKDSYVRAPA